MLKIIIIIICVIILFLDIIKFKFNKLNFSDVNITINLVSSRYKKNVEWIYNIKDINKFFIYDKEKKFEDYNNAFTEYVVIEKNKGHEASVYLKYIIDNYYKLSDYTIFVHDDEYSWHHEGSLVDIINKIDVKSKKYHNLNNGKCIMGKLLEYNHYYDWYNRYIQKTIPINKLPTKHFTEGHAGCAQFIIHKSLINYYPLKMYNDIYNWIITTDLSNFFSARYLEWTWNLLWDIYPNLKK